MTGLPEPWRIDRDGEEHYTVDQMRDYGRAEYNRAIEDAAKVCEEMERNGAWITKEEAAAHIRAIKDAP